MLNQSDWQLRFSTKSFCCVLIGRCLTTLIIDFAVVRRCDGFVDRYIDGPFAGEDVASLIRNKTGNGIE